MNTDKYFKIFKIKNISDINYYELKRRYRILVKKYHPDKGGSSSQFRLIQDSYEYILSLLKDLYKKENKKFFNDRYFYYGDGSIYDLKEKKWRKVKGKIININAIKK